MTSCAWAQLGSLVMDSETADADGILWTVTALSGWWDGTAMRGATQEVQPVGEVVTVARENGRALVLEVDATTVDRQSALGSVLCFLAMDKMKDAARCIYKPKLLTVHDPVDILQAYVRRPLPHHAAILGSLVAVKFQVALLAPDPRRYAVAVTTEPLTLVGTDVTEDFVIDVVTTVSTPFVWSVYGPSTDPKLLSHTLGLDVTHRPWMQWIGHVNTGSVLTIDTASGEVLLDGDDARASLAPGSQMFGLVPNNNDLTYSRNGATATSASTVAYRAAKD